MVPVHAVLGKLCELCERLDDQRAYQRSQKALFAYSSRCSFETKRAIGPSICSSIATNPSNSFQEWLLVTGNEARQPGHVHLQLPTHYELRIQLCMAKP